jgi:hypothetical protein
MATPRRDALTRFTDELRRLRMLAGTPSLNRLVALTAGLEHPLARSTVSDKLAAKSVPDWDFVVSFVTGCRAYAAGAGAPLPADAVDLARWETAHWRMLSELDNGSAEARLASAARAQLGRHRIGSAPTRPPGHVQPGPPTTAGPSDVALPSPGGPVELAALAGLLDELRGDTDSTVAISVVGGSAGAGRTALLVCWAHQDATQAVRQVLEFFRGATAIDAAEGDPAY